MIGSYFAFLIFRVLDDSKLLLFCWLDTVVLSPWFFVEISLDARSLELKFVEFCSCDELKFVCG
jgi:hypothetical protein